MPGWLRVRSALLARSQGTRGTAGRAVPWGEGGAHHGDADVPWGGGAADKTREGVRPGVDEGRHHVRPTPTAAPQPRDVDQTDLRV